MQESFGEIAGESLAGNFSQLAGRGEDLAGNFRKANDPSGSSASHRGPSGISAGRAEP
jgi:hypothetical protein